MVYGCFAFTSRYVDSETRRSRPSTVHVDIPRRVVLRDNGPVKSGMKYLLDVPVRIAFCNPKVATGGLIASSELIRAGKTSMISWLAVEAKTASFFLPRMVYTGSRFAIWLCYQRTVSDGRRTRSKQMRQEVSCGKQSWKRDPHSG